MPELIKNLQNNRKVIFDNGKYDKWCVYIVEANGDRKAHFDKTYFNALYNISQKYPQNKLYNDFIKIYDKTNNKIDPDVILLIDEIVNTYNIEDKISIEQWLTVLYAGMIAEENKVGAILKKRIKRLGMHQVLLQNIPAEEAANFSKKKPWEDLNAIMKNLGF